MDQEYDVIVLGTGLTECVLSGLLSVEGYKVLHMDRNDYYGGDSASLNLVQLYQKFRPSVAAPPPALGSSREYCVDLIPKFMMACGNLVRILLHCHVTRYLDFRSIGGSFVLQGSRIHKVPCTTMEALSSGLMGFFEKRRLKKFLTYLAEYNDEVPKTQKGMNLRTTPMAQVFAHFGLCKDTIDFVGHALALHSTDAYLQQPAYATAEKCRLYQESLARYANSKSPYIYPLFGLGELPQAFARLSAIYGGIYMLRKPVEEILYDADGVVCGVRSEGEVARTKRVVGDPSYFPQKIRLTGAVIRCICILNHPLRNTNDESCQIVLPQSQINRQHDIYVSCVDSSFQVCPAGKFIVIVSTVVETNDPMSEIMPALALLGNVEERFAMVSSTYEPLADGARDQCFISNSYDASSHFETVSDNVHDLYRRITGKDLVLRMPTPEEMAREYAEYS
eukprot:gnl/Spiro4/5839_TR2981_c0_g1_i1.p1 gnl/Spiro4/5839_TR2981_c0_g1~~gnl/Spiro4/5839_TR2981_c0_g1_i1.p1  ORF type:complete len:450 (+),score=123.24 gnl/Spiro4/5839_TR2981_c0_g1_i1:93-1442(+)